MDAEPQDKDCLLEGVSIGKEGPALVPPTVLSGFEPTGAAEGGSQPTACLPARSLKGAALWPYRHPKMETFIHPSNVIELIRNIKIVWL